jgi:DNA-binding FadR family transcriptional regulator
MASPALSEHARASSPPARDRFVREAKHRESLGFETALKIEAAIAQADLPVGTSIGTRRELARRYGVGRPAILAALRIVEFRGLAKMKPGPGGGVIVARPVMELVAGPAGCHLMMSGAFSIEHVRDARAVLIAVAAALAAADHSASLPRLQAWMEAHPLGRERQGRQDCHALAFPCAVADASGNVAATLFSVIAYTAVANVVGPDNPWVVTHELAVWSREVELQILDAIRIRDVDGAVRAACNYVRRLDVAGSPKYGPRPPEDTGSVVARTRAGQVARSIIFSLGTQRDVGLAPNTGPPNAAAPNVALGTIESLCFREGVCRATAVQALRMLDASGVIAVKMGRSQGYFQKPMSPAAIASHILAFLRSSQGSGLAAREFAAVYGRYRASVSGEGAPNPLLSFIDDVLDGIISG